MKIVPATVLLCLLGQPVQAEDLFVTCDNGIRCFRAPCPARDVLLLPSNRRLPNREASLERLTVAERKRVADVSGSYYGTIVFAGEIDESRRPPVTATRIVRDATKAEAALCRKRP
nr:hypothetical protein [Methylobacterium sp. ZNC0032]